MGLGFSLPILKGWKLEEKNGDLFGVFNNKMSLLFFLLASEIVTKDVAMFFSTSRELQDKQQ